MRLKPTAKMTLIKKPNDGENAATARRKNEIIKENLLGDCKEKIYSFDNLKHVFVVGFDDTDIEEIESDDYLAVMNVINTHYANEAYRG